ncbi:hypothetical protein JW926_08490 [Candidatus Sumerlaeota bacterium]|nr:hypothetical protein [Candidatus Sumerlaeota bacterium]
MNGESYIRELAEKAREERHPDVNVVPRVMAAIHERESLYRADAAPLAWIAASACALALIVGFLALSEFMMWDHPIMEILEALTWGML